MFKIKLFPHTNNLFLFLITLWLFVSSGIHFFGVSSYITNFIPFFILVITLLLLILIKNKVSMPISSILGLITIVYLTYTQIFILAGDASATLGYISAFGYYVTGIMVLPYLSKPEAFYICDTTLLVNTIFYGIDTLVRMASVHFNLYKMVVDVYCTKDKTFIFEDTNFVAVNTCSFLFLAYFMYEKTHEKKYLVYTGLFALMTYFTMSRAAMIGMFLTFLTIYFFKLIKKSFRNVKHRLNGYQIPLNKFIILTTIFLSLIISVRVIFILGEGLATDGSFLSKLKIFASMYTFLKIATPSQLCTGIGYGNEIYYLGMAAHTYIAASIICTGIIGYILLTSFLCSIVLNCKKTLYIFLPYFFYSFAMGALTWVFFSCLALIYHIEKITNKEDKCH